MHLHDLHTHNGYYRTVKVPWSVERGWRVARARQLVYLGLSNKVAFNHPAPAFLPELRGLVDAFQETAPGPPRVLVGVEVDIGARDGRLPLTPEDLAPADYVIAAPHNQPVRSLAWPDLTPDEHAEYFDALRDVLYEPLKRHPVDVWGHPFLQEVEHYGEQFWEYLAPILRELLPLCEDQGIALEINSTCFRKHHVPDTARWPSLPAYLTEITRAFARVFRVATEESRVRFVLGSDAHHVDQVGDVGFPHLLARALGIPDDRFVDPATFLERP